MQLVTQAELARHLDITRSRVNQLLKQGIFSIHDIEHNLLDRDYSAHRYELYKEENIGHVSRHREEKDQKLYAKAKNQLENELRTRLNNAFDKALPAALETYKTDYEYTDVQLEEIKDGVFMFYSELIKELTGFGLTTYVEECNPELWNKDVSENIIKLTN